jgi:peroxiredoxin
VTIEVRINRRITDRAAPSSSAEPGDVLPDAELIDAHGVSVMLDAARGGRPAVIVLYRGTWCPFCNLVLRTYQQDLVPTLGQRGVGLIAISPQKPDGSLSMQEKNELTFTVLSDPGNQVAAALGVLTAPNEAVDIISALVPLGGQV